MPKPALVAITATFVLLSSVRAHAGDPAAAQAAFEDAKRQISQGNYAVACSRFAESQRLDPGLGTQFNLANCWQRLGHTASAWILFREVEAQAGIQGQPARAQVAHDRAAALEPWLAKLAILPPPDAYGIATIEIRRDGVPLPRAAWAQPIPLDPGTHTVALVAPGIDAWQATVELAGDGKTVTMQLPALAALGPPRLARGGIARPNGTWSPPPGAPLPRGAQMTGVTNMMPSGPGEETLVVENRGSAQRTVGWFTVGAGVVGLAAGSYFAVRWLDDENRATPRCIGSVCTPEGSQLRHDGRQFGIDAAAIAGAGAAAVIIGAVLVSSAPSPRVEVRTAHVRVTPMAGPRTAGMTILGEW